MEKAPGVGSSRQILLQVSMRRSLQVEEALEGGGSRKRKLQKKEEASEELCSRRRFREKEVLIEGGYVRMGLD